MLHLDIYTIYPQEGKRKLPSVYLNQMGDSPVASASFPATMGVGSE